MLRATKRGTGDLKEDLKGPELKMAPGYQVGPRVYLPWGSRDHWQHRVLFSFHVR